jgi:hypothetical protein
MEFIQKNILTALASSEIDVIIHQQNCLGLANGGIAKVFSKEFRGFNNHCKEWCEDLDNFPLFGKYSVFDITEPNYTNKKIINSYSQLYLGNPHSQEFVIQSGNSQKVFIDSFDNRIAALQKVLKTISKDETLKDLNKGMPLIASGIAKDHSKGISNDLEYFQKIILPFIEPLIKDFKIYYL